MMVAKHGTMTSRTKNSNFTPRRWVDQPESVLREQWHEIVRQYTMSSLTFADDIFPALQGLAKRMPSQMGEYVAGMWRATLAYDLLWHSEPSNRCTRPATWRAPSWSWASTTGAVWYGWSWRYSLPHTWANSFEGLKTYYTVIQATTVTLGNDPLGQLTGGELTIKGRLIEASVTYLHQQVNIASSLQIICASSKILVTLNYDTQCYWDYAIHEPGSYHVPDGCTVYIMKMVQDEVGSRSLWLIFRRQPPLLQKYERIGLLHISWQHLLVSQIETADIAQFSQQVHDE